MGKKLCKILKTDSCNTLSCVVVCMINGIWREKRMWQLPKQGDFDQAGLKFLGLGFPSAGIIYI